MKYEYEKRAESPTSALLHPRSSLGSSTERAPGSLLAGTSRSELDPLRAMAGLTRLSVKRLASSSDAADIDWDELYGRHAEELVRFMVKLLGDRERSADLVHDTFVRAMRSVMAASRPRRGNNIYAASGRLSQSPSLPEKAAPVPGLA